MAERGRRRTPPRRWRGTRGGAPFSDDAPSVPRLWPGETVVCIATGPSLTPQDVDACRGRARVIVVNDSYRLAPWADALYAADTAWWHVHQGVPGFAGRKYTVQLTPRAFGVERLTVTGDRGLERDPRGLRTGMNSGYQSVNLAVHFGASRIVLLGFDMQACHGRTHWFGEHPQRLNSGSPWPTFRALFDTMVEPLRQLNVAVVNATRETALTSFPQVSLDEALAVKVTA